MQETRSDPSRRAIYVDIESLETDPPHVAILGVLTGDVGEDIEQLIVDPRLAPARVAKRHRLRAVEFTTAVRELVRRATDEDVPIIGWSEFDRDRLIEGCPDLARAIAGRYVNALKIGRRWRATDNRHDLLALRHIHLIASRELGLWRAYERTRLCVDGGARRVRTG